MVQALAAKSMAALHAKVNPAAMGRETMKIGELAKRSGIAASAIRYYEQAGLLPAVARAGNGYRASLVELTRSEPKLGWCSGVVDGDGING